MQDAMSEQTMQTLSAEEVEMVNGGILPIIAAAVGLDAALTGFMVSAGYW